MEDNPSFPHHQQARIKPSAASPSEIPQPESNLQPPLLVLQDYFVPPPINQINFNYYQHLISEENPIKQYAGIFSYFEEYYTVSDTPPFIPPGLHLTQDLKQDLLGRNQRLYDTMRSILQCQSKFGDQKVFDLLKQLEMQMVEFMELCMKLKRKEQETILLEKLRTETKQLEQRTKEIKEEMLSIKEAFQFSKNSQY